MSMIEHLRELRKRLFYVLIAVGVGFAIAYQFSGQIFDFLMVPLLEAMPDDQEKRMIFTGLAQPFVLDLKLGIFGGLILALPFILVQIWLFIAPGLYPKERRLVVPVIVTALLSFGLGAAFAYFLAFPVSFQYFLGYTTATIQPMLSIMEYLDFVTKMLLGFGVMFELPLVIFFLARMGLVTPQFLANNRRWAVLVIAFFSAIFTPPDAISMSIMAVPLYLLFEFSILIARVVYRERPQLVDAEGNFVADKTEADESADGVKEKTETAP